MLIGIEGGLGSGKTVLMASYLKKDFDKNKRIVCNMPLFNMEYSEFDVSKFLTNDKEYNDSLRNSTIGIDEITVYMDCRVGGSKSNLLMGYLVLQSRKRGIDIYYTTQDFDLVDYNRLIKYTNIFIVCEEIFVRNKFGEIESLDDYRRYTIVDARRKQETVTQKVMHIEPYYKYYDTDYIIEPLIKVKNAQQKKV